MKKTLVLLFFLLGLSSLYSQNEHQIAAEDLATLSTMEDTLALLAFAIVNDSLEEHRFGSCREMIPRLVTALKTKNSFQYPFERLKSVSIQYPQDSSFRVFTWQLYVDVDDYRYYGAIQMNTPDLQLFPLIDRSANMEANLEQAVLNNEKWYGSVYYNIKEEETDQGKHYLLFGFDGYSFFRKRKIIDVLIFQNGKPTFGAPVFFNATDRRGPKFRIVKEYSAEASIRMNYDELMEMIIFDHLITLNGPHGEGPTNYPDGSYEGYEWTDGKWLYVEKIFHQSSDEAPRPFPVLEGQQKTIFGKSKKGGRP
ncbi:MAG: hypothetical protein AAF798_11875 [Bacteroidota bacterium]